MLEIIMRPDKKKKVHHDSQKAKNRAQASANTAVSDKPKPKKTMLKQIQKIGKSKDKRRVCLWNKKLIDAGFSIGKSIAIHAGTSAISIAIDPNGKRKVSRVMNHGNELPVIDLKQTKSLSLAMLGEIGGKVSVEIEAGKITIKTAE